ncbi:MAG TPA: hypothetical protein VGE11_10155, partial [Pseudonocardia sp.]
MTVRTHEYQSDFARKYVAEGVAEATAEAVLQVLAARGLPVPDAVRERVLGCTDVDQLNEWLVRAVTA